MQWPRRPPRKTIGISMEEPPEQPRLLVSSDGTLWKVCSFRVLSDFQTLLS